MADLQTSLKTATQIPLDEKLYVKELSEINTLGDNNYKAFLYYEDMVVSVVENHKQYIWREELVTNEQDGLLSNSFTYPSNSVVNEIDYSGRTFNFFLNQTFSDDLIDRIKDGFYIKTVQSLSVSPTTFEKGLSTNLTFTWNVDRKDDTLVSVTLDGNDVLSQATGVNRAYNVSNQVNTKSVTLQTNVIENNLNGGSNSITNTRTSIALIPQYYGKLPAGQSPSLAYNDLQNYTKFLSSSSARSITQSYSNEILFILSINANATILDVNGFDVTNAFTKSTVNMFLADGTQQSITQYLLNDVLNSSGTYTIN